PRLTLIHNNFRFIHNYALLLQAGKTAGHGHDGKNPAGVAEVSDSPFSAMSELQPDGERRSFADAQEDRMDGRIFDGILADLGVSSHQFDTAGRGFSFRYEQAPLDMRMNTEGGMTAADIVNGYAQEELEKVLRLYGEVENAGKVARLIVSARDTGIIETTGDLDRAIAPAVPRFAEHKYLAKVYQALRIEVNQEMRSLEKFLQGATASLKAGGRLVVITYHSLEDRMVKNFIKTGNVDGEIRRDIYGPVPSPLKAVNRKPILPGESEISTNTRARSAKLRIAELTAGEEVKKEERV
ncbi:MAG: 16S rRNA (cytosine(1402)-N(4))-methyltransferase RsmH, partial [Bacteroidales bacterium]|nr:16S rRNA (cytosine(1402)-N(4))-methyltransferase RsmH [Bacteroidales bacterium]